MNMAWAVVLRMLAVALLVAFTRMDLSAGEPFDNWANPKGFYFVDYPAYYGSQAMNDKDGEPNTVPDADLHIYQNILRVVYYDTKPMSYLLSLYVPVGRMDLLDEHTGVKIGDPTLVGGWFFVDNRQTNTYVGLGLKVDLPTGSYNPNRLANLGSNVVRYRPLLSFAKLAGPFDLEATLIYSMRTENKDSAPRKKLGNEVIFESYGGMFLSKQLLAGLHVNYRSGADTEYNGVKLPDSGPKVFQAGASVTWMASPTFSALLEVLTDLSAKNEFQGTLWLSRLAWKVF